MSLCLKKIEDIAKKVIETTKRHSPQIIFEHHKKMTIGILKFEGDKEKELMIETIRTMIKKNNIKKYIIIFDSYIGNNLNIRPSKDPNRQSCLTINQYTDNGKQDAFILNTYEEVNDKIIWKKRKVLIGADTQVNSIWNAYKEYITINGIPLSFNGVIDK